MTSLLWHVTSQSSLTLVYMLKINDIEFEDNFFDKARENVRDFLPEDY